MNLKKALAGAVTAGVLFTGVGAGVAYADSPPAGDQRPGTQQPARGLGLRRHHRKFDCSKASQVLARLEQAKTRIPERVAKLTDRKAKAEAAGKTNLARRIQQRIDRLNQRLTRIPKVEAKIQQKCASTAPQS